MKKLFILILLCTGRAVLAQTDSSATGVDSAMQYLTGAFKKYNPARAFDLFMQRANAGEAKAMNAVGLQYAKGLGTDTNFNQAVYWLTQAADNGYTKAWVNLGMLYKRNSSDSAGYAVAFNYFNTALQQNEPSAFFAKGYMLYKGLGCTQSYADALTLFRQGIDLGRPDCMYFTGLCYKFGYGVTADSDSAGYYINKAALLGYRQANAELASTITDSTAARSRKLNKIIPAVKLKKAIAPYSKPAFIKEFIQIEGTYAGWITQYDYSGKLILSKLPLTLELKAGGNRLAGIWQQAGNDPVEITAVQNGNRLDFSSSAFLAQVVKAKRKKYALVFKSAQFEKHSKGDSIFLTGSLQLYNTLTRETEKPVQISLAAWKTTNHQLPASNLVFVYPNPVAGSFNIAFTLVKSTPVKINIYTTQGQLVYTAITETLQPGKQAVTVDKELPAAGIYILVIRGNNIHETIAFVKE